jgi:hypothetical protein
MLGRSNLRNELLSGAADLLTPTRCAVTIDGIMRKLRG